MMNNRAPQASPALSRVARLYYEHNLTHAEIAEILGVSRVKVTRMLNEARRQGIVEIKVHGETSTFSELESRLVKQLGLRAAWVVPSSSSEDRLRASLGTGGAHSLRALLAPGMVVGVNQSRTVSAVPAALGTETTVDARFVPIAGSAGGTGRSKAHETSEALARAFGGSAYHLPAPLLASSGETAAVLKAESEIADTLALAARADMLLVGVGTLEDNYLRRGGQISSRTLRAMGDRHVVGDMSLRFFDADGQPAASAIDDRVIALTLEQHRAVPLRVALAAGEDKREALAAAAKGGLYNVLVTDSETATWLVDNA
jgi:lsr operon transcriptional repressor